MKRFFTLLAAVLFLLVFAVGFLYMDLMRYARTPLQNEENWQTVEIRPGAKLHEVAAALEKAAILSHPSKFRFLARFEKKDRDLKSGEYRLSPHLSPLRILETLVEGKSILYRVTIPEGFTLEQIAGKVADKGLTDKESFLVLAKTPQFVQSLGIKADSLEGYLFPDTYLFPKTAGAKEILEKMIQRFWEVMSPGQIKRAKDIGLTVHQAVTLASIIEKETGNPLERKTISSVFHNRLKKKMRLQSDPTVIYGLEDFNGNLTRRHLTTRTPYNTYTNIGLPPGPIASPGRGSLMAALYPEDTRFLYFVSKDGKSHVFSKTLAEHNRAVRKYQLGK